MDGWANAGESYFLVECSAIEERKIFKGFEGLAYFVKLKRMYGTVAVKVTALDKNTAEVLYGDEIQNK